MAPFAPFLSDEMYKNLTGEPGSVCETEEELYKNINVDDAPFYEEFYNIFCSVHNGESADKVAIFNFLCAIVLIWPFPIALIFVALLRKRKYRLEKEHHSSKIEVAVKIQEILDNIMAIRSYSAEERIYSELDEIISHEEKAHIKAEKPNAYIIGSLTSLMRLGSITLIEIGRASCRERV